MKTKLESVGKSLWHCNVTCFFFFILLSYCTSSVAQSITWERTYDRAGNFIDGIECSVMDDSGNFVLAGWTTIPPFTIERLWLLKIRPNGDTLWTRMIEIRGYVLSISNSGDGGFVITGDAGQAFAVKINANGFVIWQRFYGGVGVQLEKISRTSDNGFIMCGIYDLTNAFVMKVNSDGMLQRQYILQVDSRFLDVKETPEGDYILCGVTYEGIQCKSLIMKLDSLLNPIWLRSFSIELCSYFRDVHLVKNGFTLLGQATSEGFDEETTLTRVNDEGDSISYHKISRVGTELSPKSVKLSENRFAYIAILDSASGLIGIAAIVDTTGSIIAYGRFPFRGYSEFYTISRATHGDFLFGGITSPSNTSNNIFGYSVRTDSLLRFKPMSSFSSTTSVSLKEELVTVQPNPFNSTMNISFKVVDPSVVELSIYDLSGRKVSVPIDRPFPTGEFSISINATDLQLASGTYFLLYSRDGNTESILKIIFLK